MTKRRVVLGIVLGMAALLLSGCRSWWESPPAPTPIYITATPDLPIAPIIATETPAATSVLAATPVVALPTQGEFRTATPTPAPPITMTPSFTPTATDTPVTPGALGYISVGGQVAAGAGAGGTCANTPQGNFGAIYQGDSNLQAALGCALSGGSNAVTSAYQPFQNGVMFWVSSLGTQPQSTIYALFNNGTYQRLSDTFLDGVDPASSGAVPPAGMSEPVRGFGKVWRDNPTVRDTIGWAVAGESGGTAQILVFERGEMVSVSQAGQTYIMITGSPGTWTARAGG
ncbi:MAG: hypothetical protein HY866_03175 [Chloroflexi bacterium]|nr:hypothetical protein [Chloroflexota bacterium]